MFAMLTMMLLQLAGVVAVSGTASLSAGSVTTPLGRSAKADLILDPVVLDFCRLLVNEARAEREMEQAAYVVRTPAGALYFVWWPAAGERNSVEWRGPIPRGAIALVHTHPPWLPMPSRLDMATASRTRLPVYVVTPFLVLKTTGGPAEMVLAGEWAKP